LGKSYDIGPSITVDIGRNDIGFDPEREEPGITTSTAANNKRRSTSPFKVVLHKSQVY
jgi:hypothetical protein